MPTILKGQDVTALVVNDTGSNIWQCKIYCASGLMATRVSQGGSYTDGIEASSDEQIWMEFDATPAAVDFNEGDTVVITLDAVVYTVVLNVSMVASTPYYLDDNGTPFTDAALTTPVFGNITNETIGIIEPQDQDSEFTIAEDMAISEETDSDAEQNISESMGITEDISTDDVVNEVDELMGVTEEINSFVGAIASKFVKTNPPSTTSWTKREGEIT